MLSTGLKNQIIQNFTQEKLSKTQHYSELELEARFGTVDKSGHFIPGVSRQVFNRVKSYFDSKAKVIHSKITDYIMGKVRKSIITVNESNQIEWITKERYWNQDDNNYNIRYSMSKETKVPPISDEYFKPETLREKNRYSYLVFNDSVRIDITIVNMVKLNANIGQNVHEKDTYEIEVELLKNENLDSFEKALAVTLKLVLDTISLYTEKERYQIVNEINSILGSSKRGVIDNFPIVQARNLKLRDMVYGGLIGNSNTGYSVTMKADGIRKLLFFAKTGVYLVSPPSSIMKISESEITSLTGTILDGEMIPLDKRLPGSPKTNIWYLTFDTLAWNRNINIQNTSHLERLNLAQKVADIIKSNLLQVNTKTFRSFQTPKEFFEIMRDMLRERYHLTYKQDGFMFTPQNVAYNPHSDNHPLYKRILTDMPDICKWKPKNELTIDFQIQWRMDSSLPSGRRIELYSNERGKPVLFSFNGDIPIDHLNPLTINLPNNSIVEYGYDTEKKMLVPTRVRHDKVLPNKLDVARDVWSDIQDPIEESTLRGDDFILLRKYHNRIKKKLFDLVLQDSEKEDPNFKKKQANKTLLDIGSGYGGDLGKWKIFDRIICVEPDPEHVKELEKRIVTYNMQDKIKIVIAGGQETKKIREAVEEFLGKGAKVDVVSSMLSLTFFWQSENLINSLVDTIVSNIKENGKYIFLTMDGELVEQTFEPKVNQNLPNRLNLNKLVLGPASLEYKGDVIPHELLINIKGTIVENQREWLVKLNDLILRMGNFGFTMSLVHKADEEKFLTEEEIIMTQMYTYGMFTRKNDLSPNEVKNFNRVSHPSLGILKVDNTYLPSIPITDVDLSDKKTQIVVSEKIQKEEESVEVNNELIPIMTPMTPVKSESNLLPATILPPLNLQSIKSNLLPLTNLPPLNLPIQKNKTLSMDESEKIKWRNEDIVVIGNLKDQNSLLHAILNAFLNIYQTNSNKDFRQEFAQELRMNLAEHLSDIDSNFPDKTIYETSEFPVSYKELYDLLIGSDNISNIKEIYNYIAESLGIDIYVINYLNEELTVRASNENNRRKSIVISSETESSVFETVAMERDELYQTYFDSDDPFILKLRQ
jgi:hypothetical protein